MAITISRLTREFIFWPVNTPNDLSLATAEVAFMSDPAQLPSSNDWEEAELLEMNNQWRVRILVGPDHQDSIDLTPPSSQAVDYQTWVRITDSPERPVRRPGVLTVE